MRIAKAQYFIEDQIDGVGICKKIEKAGRTCYLSDGNITGDSYIEFIKKIISNGHHSVLEHEKISVRFIFNRGVSHEMVRHRLSSFSQESTRFCNYSKNKFDNNITIIDPCFWPEKNIENTLDYQKFEIWLETIALIEKNYLKLIELGAQPQEARDILPNALKTEIVVTANLREWRWIFHERAINKKAHPQMREVMMPLLDEFKKKIPVVFDDLCYT